MKDPEPSETIKGLTAGMKNSLFESTILTTGAIDRLVAQMKKSAVESEKYSRWLVYATIATAVATICLVIVTSISIWCR